MLIYHILGVFMRSLQAVWQWRGPQNTALANYIEAYMNVQYNAIQGLSGNPAKYTFGPAWTGPAYQQLNPGDQSAAINVFNSAISMAPFRCELYLVRRPEVKDVP